jgi:Flp pilus assembly protein TadD
MKICCYHLARQLFLALMLLTASAVAAPALDIERRPGSAAMNGLLEQAWGAWRTNDLVSAREHYSRARQIDVRNRDALLGLAAIALQQGNDAAAMDHFGRLLLLDPRDAHAHAGLSLLGSLPQAESQLQRLLEQQPDHAALHFALGCLYGTQARWSDARDAYAQAHRLNPAEVSPLLNLAISLDHLGDERAAAHYRHALQRDEGGKAFDHAAVMRRLQQLELQP